MSMQHLLLTNENLSLYQIDDNIYLNEDDSIHIAKSLRMNIGEQISISDNFGNNFITVITGIEKKVELKIIDFDTEIRELKFDLDIYQGIPKGDKIEIIVQKLCELGVRKFIPVKMNRCISIIDKKKEKKKIDRLQAIADNAANQSKRQKRLMVENVININNIPFESYDIVLFAYENEKTYKINSLINNILKSEKIALIVGPEGGFDNQEIEFIINKNNTYTVSLGKRILRTETASIAAVSYIMLSAEE